MVAKLDPSPKSLQVVVSADHMEVSLRVTRTCSEVTPPIVLDALRAQKTQITPAIEAEVEKLCKREDPLKAKEICTIGHGVPPVHATAPRVELVASPHSEGEGRDRSAIPSATQGMIVGVIVPGTPGQNGVDVFAKPVPFRAAAKELPLGPNVELSADGKSIIALSPGLIQVKAGKLGVETAMEVQGNLDYSVGNINFAGSVLIRGNVADLFKIVAKEDIYVGGAVEAADLHGGHNVEVHGGICCRDKGHVSAGNDLRAKFISNTTIDAGNDIIVHSEIANSRITCKRHLSVVNGPVYASHVTAAGGVTAVTLGSSAHAKTLIECGIDAVHRKTAAEKLPEIQASLKRVAKVREVIEPLLKHQKNLTAAQKEKATEMLYEADLLQRAADETMREIAAEHKRYLETSATAEVIVSGIIHPGVTIRFPEMETTVRMPIKGPVRIVCRNVRGQWSILAVHDATKLTQQLELRGVQDDLMRELAKALGEGKHLHLDAPAHTASSAPPATTTLAA